MSGTIKNPAPKLNRHLLPKKRSKGRFLLLFLMGFVVLCVSKPYSSQPIQSGPPPVVSGDVEPPPKAAHVEPEPPAVKVEEKKVRSGETLSDILRAKGLSETTIISIANRKIDGISPSRLVAGRVYRLFSRDGRLIEYQYEPDDERILRIFFGSETPVLKVEPIPYEVFRVPLAGTIEDSLFAAVEKIGESPTLAMDLTEIFAWQVDFFRDLRKGDTFEVLVDKYYREGAFVRYGKIMAARFVNNGTTYNAILFTPAGSREDYFDETGGSLRKQFLKAPLKFRRISSGFSRRRLNPVTGRIAPHLGIDYAAPIGTPIRAVGDGKVLFKKYDSVNGRLVKIRHNGMYCTAYGHMSRFARGIKKGTRVQQGQIIGYVGQSGRATGPHLHFAMYKNGRYVDPRGISVPKASSIPAGDRAAFMRKVKEVALLMEGGPQELVAEDGTKTDVLR